MPNYVTCRIIAQDFETLKKVLVDDEGYVDFNKVIPMHKDLEITSGSYSYEDTVNCFYDNRQKRQFIKAKEASDAMLSQLYNDTISQADFLAKALEDDDIIKAVMKTKGWYTRKSKNRQYPMSKDDLKEGLEIYIKGYFNIQRYGHKDWYDWHIEKWGTKWNACDSHVDEENKEITFQTAWSVPDEVLLEVAKHTPLRLLYADEDLGRNCGLGDYFVDEEGNPTYDKIMDGSVELACEAWGYGHVEVYDDNYDEITDVNNPKYVEANKNYFSIQEEINALMTPECVAKDLAEV